VQISVLLCRFNPGKVILISARESNVTGLLFLKCSVDIASTYHSTPLFKQSCSACPLHMNILKGGNNCVLSVENVFHHQYNKFTLSMSLRKLTDHDIQC